MRKELKAQVIETIAAQLKETPSFYVTDIAGLNAEQTVALRRACFEAGIKLTVVKNTLFEHVIKEMGNEELSLVIPALKGNSAIMYTEVANAPAKLIKKLRKEIDNFHQSQGGGRKSKRWTEKVDRKRVMLSYR